MTDLFGDTCPCCGQSLPDREEPTFAAFWQKSNKRGSKPVAERAWAKLGAADRIKAEEKLAPFYAWFKREYPTASLMHISSYLNGRYFDQAAIQGVKALTPAEDPAIKAIKSGKRHLCVRISAARARALISQGFVTENDCRAVGIL